jgi:SAM-dependent methyltransferase
MPLANATREMMAAPSTPAYSVEFYETQSLGSRRSADIVLPVVKALVDPASVVDVGCGVGTWLASWRALGVADVLGIDGSWVDRAMLQIPPSCFEPRDLTSPIRLERRFDLAMSLEVAEHLDARYADDFVASLVALAPAVLFSAAIPGQGGRHHVNEQWPEYWRDKFARHGYQLVDCVRRRVWTAPIDYCYAQNTVLYVAGDLVETNPILREERRANADAPLNLVHPEHYRSVLKPLSKPGRLFGLLLASLGPALRRRAARRFGGGKSTTAP